MGNIGVAPYDKLDITRCLDRVHPHLRRRPHRHPRPVPLRTRMGKNDFPTSGRRSNVLPPYKH